MTPKEKQRIGDEIKRMKRWYDSKDIIVNWDLVYEIVTESCETEE